MCNRKTNNEMKKLILIAVLLWAGALFAQTDSVQTQKVTVTRTYEPQVRDADKINVNPPQTVSEDFRKIPVDYQLRPVEAVSTFKAEKGAMARPRISRTLTENRPGYARFSVGWPGQARLAGGYVHTTANDWQTGGELRFAYLGGREYDGPDAMMRTTLALHPFAEKDGDLLRMKYRLDYDLLASQFQVLTGSPTAFGYHRINPAVQLDFHRTVFKNVEAGYRFLTGYTLGEHQFKLGWENVFPIGGFAVHTRWDIDELTGRADTISYNNFQAGFAPSLQLEKEKLLFKLGLKLYYQNRTDVNDQVLFYPDLSVDFRMIDEYLTVYIGYSGGLETRSYDRLLRQTPYVNTSRDLRPTSTAYRVAGGFKGALSSRMAYTLELGVERHNDFPFLASDTTGGMQRFMPLFDNLDDYYFKVLLSYVHPGFFETKIRFLYGQYTPETLSKAFNIPDYSVAWLLRFDIGKFGWESELAYVGPRFDFALSAPVKLPEYVDTRLNLSYRLDKHWKIFLTGNDLLNQAPMHYLNYPGRGLAISAGVFYGF